MAIYHLNVKAREAGAGAPACSYIQRRGKYAKADDMPVAQGSGGLPAWANGDPLEYFAAADNYEEAGKLRGSQATKAKAEAEARGEKYEAKEGTAIAGYSMDIALPAELTDEQRQKCAQEFVQSVASTKQGILPHIWAIHAPDPDSDARNHHLHIMLGTRPDDQHPRPHPADYFRRGACGKDKSKGGAKKAPGIGSRNWLGNVRKCWQDVANKHLAAAGFDERIDCRTLEAQGIDREPGKHLSLLEYEAEKSRRQAEYFEDEARRLEAAAEEERERLAANPDDVEQHFPENSLLTAEEMELEHSGPRPSM